MTLYEALVISTTLIGLKNKEFPFSFAMDSAKIIKEIETERTLLREVLNEQWLKEYDTTWEKADKETRQKMDQEFVTKAQEHTVEVKTKLNREKLEEANVMLTTEQATILMPLFNEE